MSKKIDEALKALTKALRKHAEAVGDRHVSLKKTQRAAAKLATAATEYAAAVHAKTGQDSPFDDSVRPGLETATLASLEAERDALAKHSKSPSSKLPSVKSPSSKSPSSKSPDSIKSGKAL